MEDAQLKLNNGKIPIQVWVSDVATISFFTNLGGLEEDFNEALALLDAAYFSMDQCVNTFLNSTIWEEGKEICARTIAGILLFIYYFIGIATDQTNCRSVHAK